MADTDTLGGSSKRTKICYDNDGIQACNEYFAVTNLETNKVEWHRDDKSRGSALSGTSVGQTTVIGTYDPKTKKFTPNDKALASQAKYFTSKEGTNQIAQITKTSNTKSLVENGRTPEEAQQEAEQLSEGNYARPTEDGVDEETTPAPESKRFKDSGEDKDGTRRNFGTFMYPENLGETTQDYIKIDMMKYEAAGLDIKKDRAGLGGEGRDGQERKSVGSVILPIPGGIKDSNKATWGGDSMNSLEMEAADLALGFIKTGNISEFVNELNTKIKPAGTQEGQNAIANAFTAAAIGKDFKSLMSRSTGQIMNPNMELLFQSPSLRPFSFTFLLAPRTKTEAQQVIQIIRFFKQGMAPIRSEANLFLKAPNTFQLQYKHRGENHPYLNKFKECALQTCDINYTPQNNYSTFEDGVMNAYEMTLSFQELTPVYNDDYENTDETSASSLTGGVEWDLVGNYSSLGGGDGQAPASIEIGY